MTSPPPIPEKAEIAFISGPLDTGPDNTYFHTHYVPLINAAIDRGHRFVIGPVAGVDRAALDYLLAYPIPPSHITVFVTPTENILMGDEFRSRAVNVHVVDGSPNMTTRDRDAAMTRASSYDILRWRPTKESKEFYGRLYREGYVTNTEMNWRRRRGIGETEIVREEDVSIFGDEKKRSWGRRAVYTICGSFRSVAQPSKD
ncbi:hypothetical protein ABOM_011628 [Aspergillus bombycis]|uniref:Uncharacterized protein n=1 Tax=Aspergillus bombycis TaxID=109264 RepID=A0A1F7ZJR4_9EURO|nr:hypothetical protein ABOM_011628 [Aspergillus bombycis]OGM39686.1 hypothetical protein ABOM_011628 [Aspergillus bombycis]